MIIKIGGKAFSTCIFNNSDHLQIKELKRNLIKIQDKKHPSYVMNIYIILI